MPYLGLGLHAIVAIFFAVHAIRTNRETYWLWILFAFPLLGSVVYFFGVFLPDSRLERAAIRTIQKTLDPSRDLREAQREFDLTPTAHNQMRLAAALLEAGYPKEAVEQYDACLRGPFAADAAIGIGAARARLANGQPQQAIELLAAVRERHPGFSPEQVGLLLASAYDAAGLADKAGLEYEEMAARFGTIESRAHLALWAIRHRQAALAERELAELRHARKHMNRHTRDLHQELFRRLDEAAAQLG